MEAIDRQELLPKSRLYVHLSADTETARKVGQRHGKPVIYRVDCKKMAEDGYKFLPVSQPGMVDEESPGGVY